MDKMLMKEASYFGENLDMCFKNTLAYLKTDVKRCFKWLDLGLSPCACGLMGPAPKPLNEIPHLLKPNSEGPDVNAAVKACVDRGKAKMGFVGPGQILA
jgi:hypothetical protein